MALIWVTHSPSLLGSYKFLNENKESYGCTGYWISKIQTMFSLFRYVIVYSSKNIEFKWVNSSPDWMAKLWRSVLSISEQTSRHIWIWSRVAFVIYIKWSSSKRLITHQPPHPYQVSVVNCFLFCLSSDIIFLGLYFRVLPCLGSLMTYLIG